MIVLAIGATVISVGVGAFAFAQQTAVNLSEGDDVTIECPTALSVDFDVDNGALVRCAAEAPASDESAPEQPSEPESSDES
jgi:hypothetical protein